MKSGLVQCRIFLLSAKKYRAWIELVLCTKCAECCDKTEIRAHECPVRIRVSLGRLGRCTPRIRKALPSQLTPTPNAEAQSTQGRRGKTMKKIREVNPAVDAWCKRGRSLIRAQRGFSSHFPNEKTATTDWPSAAHPCPIRFKERYFRIRRKVKLTRGPQG